LLGFSGLSKQEIAEGIVRLAQVMHGFTTK
jgi:DNA-binding transcriptional MocR family regulator